MTSLVSVIVGGILPFGTTSADYTSSTLSDSSTHCVYCFFKCFFWLPLSLQRPCTLHNNATPCLGATGTVSIELYFIMTSIWFGTTYYYVFGFLLVVGLLLFITLAEMSITLTYFQLCAEDYNWWWRSFFVSGSCAVYVFLYSCYFFVTQR